MERRVVFDFVNVIRNESTLSAVRRHRFPPRHTPTRAHRSVFPSPNPRLPISLTIALCALHLGPLQSLIRDRRCPQLYLLAASQTRDKTALTEEGVQRVIAELQQQFDYIICDSPAGIESGALHAMYFADRAIICTNPEVSSVRDSDKMLGILNRCGPKGRRRRPELGVGGRVGAWRSRSRHRLGSRQTLDKEGSLQCPFHRASAFCEAHAIAPEAV